MANKTLLDAVNEIFKRSGEIAGDAAALTSLTDSARQHPIDVAVQVVNEGVDELYSYTSEGKPGQQAESTITLVTDVREYNLASDLIELHFPLIDKTNTQFIFAFAGGYDEMLLMDPEQDDDGLPYYAAINPVNGMLHMDRTPTSVENGNVYTYQYEKNLGMSLLTDIVPFNDAVFRSIVPAWVQLYKREIRNQFDQPLYQQAIGRAARFLSQVEPRKSYNPRSAVKSFNVFDN